MQYLVFGYNIALIIIFTIVGFGYFALYLIEKKQLYIWVALLCVCFIFDNIIIYMTEIFEEFSIYYDLQSLSSNVLKTIISIAIMLSYIMIIRYVLQKKIARSEITALFLYSLLLLFIPLIKTSNFNFWLYFTVTQLICIFLLVNAYNELKDNKIQQKKIKNFFIITFLLNVLIIIEDFIVIFYFDVVNIMQTRINQRNFSEDILSLYFMYVAFFMLLKELKTKEVKNKISDNLPIIKADETEPGPIEPEPIEPELTEPEPTEPEPIEPEPVKTPYKFDKIEAFCLKYMLTERERQVLELILLGKTNTQIGEELFISLGTAKNHIHNIYQKCGVARRSQLILFVNNISS